MIELVTPVVVGIAIGSAITGVLMSKNKNKVSPALESAWNELKRQINIVDRKVDDREETK